MYAVPTKSLYARVKDIMHTSNILSRILTSAFFRNFSRVFLSTATGQLTSILIMPMVTRLAGPKAYGDYSLYISVFVIFSTFSSGKYDQGIFVAGSSEGSRRFFILTIRALLFIVPISVFIFGITSLFFNFENGMKVWWLLLIPAQLAAGWNNAAYNLANREGQFRQISRSRLVASTSINILNLFFVAIGFGAIGLAVGHLLSFVMSSLMLIRMSDFLEWNKSEKLSVSLKYAKENYKYPLFLVPSELIGNLIQQLPVFVFSSTGNALIVGYFSLVQRLIGIPLGLLVSSMSIVLKERFIRERDVRGDCVPLFLKMSLLLGVIGIVIAVILFITADWLVPFLFGQQWANASLYLKWSLLPFVFRFCVSPLTYIFLIYNKQAIDLIMQVSSLAIVVVGFLISFSIPVGENNALIGFSISSSVMYVMYYVVSLSIVFRNRRGQVA